MPPMPRDPRRASRARPRGDHRVALVAPGREEATAVTTRVTMRDYGDAEIEAYVATGEPLDKAGAYGVQGLGAHLVAQVDGCLTNVVGLPSPRRGDSSSAGSALSPMARAAAKGLLERLHEKELVEPARHVHFRGNDRSRPARHAAPERVVTHLAVVADTRRGRRGGGGQNLPERRPRRRAVRPELVRGGRANPGERSEQRARPAGSAPPARARYRRRRRAPLHRRSAEPARRLGGRAEIGERHRLALVDEARRPGVLHHGGLDRARFERSDQGTLAEAGMVTWCTPMPSRASSENSASAPACRMR